MKNVEFGHLFCDVTQISNKLNDIQEKSTGYIIEVSNLSELNNADLGYSNDWFVLYRKVKIIEVSSNSILIPQR